MSKTITLRSLKRKYPHPVMSRSMSPERYIREDHYCVAGALCREVGMSDYSFPEAITTMDALRKANRRIGTVRLTYEEYGDIRSQIHSLIRANDCGSFELAWRIMGYLLKWKPRGRDEAKAVK